MKARILGIASVTFLYAAAAGAQTKISGTAQCGKPETVGKADAGDRAGHTMELGKGSCTWTTPLEMAGLKSKDGNSVSFVEATSTRSSGTGTFVGNMDNGDKFFVSFHDSTTIKNGQPAGPSKGTWSYTGGTGELKGLQGKGTYILSRSMPIEPQRWQWRAITPSPSQRLRRPNKNLLANSPVKRAGDVERYPDQSIAAPIASDEFLTGSAILKLDLALRVSPSQLTVCPSSAKSPALEST